MNNPAFEERFAGYPAALLALIHDFQATRDPALVSPIMRGILAKYAPEGFPLDLGDTPETTLGALGFESLTLIEIVLDLQDALGIELPDDELRAMQSFDDVSALLAKKVAALRDPAL